MLSFSLDMLWRNALGVIPLALIASLICKVCRCRPSTKFALWFLVLLRLLIPPINWSPDLREGWGRVQSWASSWRPAQSAPVMVSLDQPMNEPTAPNRSLDRHSPRIDTAPVLESTQFESRPEVSSPSMVSLTSEADFHQARELLTLLLRPPAVILAGQKVAERTEPEPASWEPIAASVSDASPAYLSRWLESFSNVQATLSVFLRRSAPLMFGLAAVLIATHWLRTYTFVARTRRKRRTDPELTAVVRSLARRLKLRVIPRAYVVEVAISPMVLIRSRPEVLVPRALWAALNDREREAVICHELAHLRRKDHWVRVAEIVAGALYWWHPVMWWVRARLRDEAEYCCDAWVTATLPNGRKAYASALIKAHEFLSSPWQAPPASGIGMSAGQIPAGALAIGGRAARLQAFSRRITMIMTESFGHRLSLRGLMLAAVLAAAASWATPAWSCPDGEKACHSGSTPAIAPVAPVSPSAPTAAWAQLAGDPPRHGHPDAHLDELAMQLEHLRAELHRIESMLSSARHRPGGTPAPALTTVPDRAGLGRAVGFDVRVAGENCTRNYELNEEKANALYELLAPSHVTVVVSRTDHGINISGVGDQCEILDAFADVYTRGEREFVGSYEDALVRWEDSWDSDVSYSLPDETVELLFAVLAFDDVPVLVSRGDGGIQVKAASRDQRTVARLVQLVRGESNDRIPRRQVDGLFGDGERKHQEKAEKEARKAEDKVRKIEEKARKAEEKARRKMEDGAQWDSDEWAREADELRREAEELAREHTQMAEEFAREQAQMVEELAREQAQMAEELAHEQAEAARELAHEMRERAMEEAENDREADQESRENNGLFGRIRDRFSGTTPRSDQPAPRANRQAAEGERRYTMPRDRAELVFNLLAPSYVEDVLVRWDGDALVITGSEGDLQALDRVVDILTRAGGEETPRASISRSSAL